MRGVTFYYARVDNNGVLCVDQLGDKGDGEQVVTEEQTAELAVSYPNVVYFTV